MALPGRRAKDVDEIENVDEIEMRRKATIAANPRVIIESVSP